MFRDQINQSPSTRIADKDKGCPVGRMRPFRFSRGHDRVDHSLLQRNCGPFMWRFAAKAEGVRHQLHGRPAFHRPVTDQQGPLPGIKKGLRQT